MLTRNIGDDMEKVLKQVFANDNEQDKWWDWMLQQPMPFQDQWPTAMNLQDFREKLLHCNYAVGGQLGMLAGRFYEPNQPLVPVGWDHEKIYAISPNCDLLQVHPAGAEPLDPGEEYESGDFVFGIEFDLGIPGVPKELRTFFQLGSLLNMNSSDMRIKSSWEGKSVFPESEKDYNTFVNGKWKSTNYAAVVDITSGAAGAVWIIFNFFPLDAQTKTERYHFDWERGYFTNPLGRDRGKISMAKIAHSIADLGIRHRMLFNEVRHEEPELSYVLAANPVRSSKGLFAL